MKPVSSKLLYGHICQLVMDISPTISCTITKFFNPWRSPLLRQDALQKKMSVQKKVSLRAITGYTPAKLITGKRWYVEFYAFDPEKQNLHRKRVSVPPVKPQSLRKRHAADMAAEINAKLAKGWNPFLALTNPNSYVLFRDVCEKYFRYLYKLTEDGIMRIKTYNGYTSFLNVFSAWNDRQDRPVNYIYQLKSEVVSDFLDHIWMDEGKSARTRDNYLGWFRSFASWLMEKKYINEDFTAGMSNMQGKGKRKRPGPSPLPPDDRPVHASRVQGGKRIHQAS